MIQATLTASSTALANAASAVGSVVKASPDFLAKVGGPRSQAIIAGATLVVYGTAIVGVAGYVAVRAASPHVARGTRSAYGWARAKVTRQADGKPEAEMTATWTGDEHVAN
jgi:hypothetical protein